MFRIYLPPTLALTLALSALHATEAQAQQTTPGPRKLAPMPAPLPRTHTPKPTKGAITVEDLKTRLYGYADDSMAGREAGTLGNVKATDYIAAEAKRIGLKPAGDSGTYFQTLPIKGMAIKTASFTIGSETLTLGTDYTPYIGFGGPGMPGEMRDTAVQFIFAGRAGEPYKLTSEQTKDKLVVFLPATKETLEKNPQAMNQFAPRADNGIGLGFASMDQWSATRRESSRMSPVTLVPAGRQIAKSTGKPIIYLSNAGVQKIFGKPVDQIEVGATSTAPAAVSYEFGMAPAQYPARNIVAILPGSDPALSQTYVAIGAHNDHEGIEQFAVDHDSLKAFNHIARIEGAEGRPIVTTERTSEIGSLIAEMRKKNPPRRDSILNGADDDGSGSMGTLEIAEYLASLTGKARPKRSILFIWHTGEEKGLWGSLYYTDNPTVPRDSIVAQLNLDMIGRGEASDLVEGNPNYLQLIGSRRLSTELGDLVEAVNTDKKHGFKFDYSFDANGHPQNIYCRSDHWSYARFGIPVTFFTTGGHPDYHQVTDEPQYINYEHLARVTSLISDIALGIANREQRPTVDKAKPDPRGQCRQ